MGGGVFEANHQLSQVSDACINLLADSLNIYCKGLSFNQ